MGFLRVITTTRCTVLHLSSEQYFRSGEGLQLIDERQDFDEFASSIHQFLGSDQFGSTGQGQDAFKHFIRVPAERNEELAAGTVSSFIPILHGTLIGCRQGNYPFDSPMRLAEISAKCLRNCSRKSAGSNPADWRWK
jgi:hypothetical protein